MGRCGCASNVCTCTLIGGVGMSVAGSGTETDPYILTGVPAKLQVIDSPSIDLTLTGNGADTTPYQLRADVAVAGLTTIQVADSGSVDLTLTGTGTGADPYVLQADALGGSRNSIRNGDMSVAQRGDGPFVAFGNHIDGWRTEFSGGTISVRRVLPTLGSIDAKWAMEITNAGSAASTDYVNTRQKIEGVERHAGKQVVVSFVAWANAGTPKVSVEMEQFFGNGGSPSATVDTPLDIFSLSTTRKRYFATVALPSITGKALGTDNKDHLAAIFWQSAGAGVGHSGVGIQNSVITITDVQVEEGTVPTKFERLSRQAQLAWCQRFHWRRTATGSGVPLAGGGVAWTTGSYYFDIPNPVPMRAAPTVTGGGATSFAIATNGTSSNTTAGPASAGAHTVDNIEINFTCPAIGIAAGAAFLRSNQTTYIDADAEL